MAARAERQPVFDWTSHPSVKSKMRKEYRQCILYSVLAFPAAALLTFSLFFDGVQVRDAIFVPVLALVLFWGILQVTNATTFYSTYVGMKVYNDGIALPWRSRADARNGTENFLSFAEIREVRLVGTAIDPVVVVVKEGGSKPSKFAIDSMWIPDISNFMEFLAGRLRVQRANF